MNRPHSPPDEDALCEVCGKEPEHTCDCPPCEHCSITGDPTCYTWATPTAEPVPKTRGEHG